jgi:hypothetical protein
VEVNDPIGQKTRQPLREETAVNIQDWEEHSHLYWSP